MDKLYSYTKKKGKMGKYTFLQQNVTLKNIYILTEQIKTNNQKTYIYMYFTKKK